MKANSLKDQEHLSSIKFAVKLNKEEYYHGEEVLGFIKIMLREEKTIYNILLRFKQKEFWETSDNHVIREKTLYKQLIEINKYAVEHKNPNNPEYCKDTSEIENPNSQDDSFVTSNNDPL